MSKQIPITKTDLEKLISDGLKISQIAKHFKCSASTVRTNLRKFEISFKKPPVDKEKLNRLILSGCSSREIAEQLGCSDGYARQLISNSPLDYNYVHRVPIDKASLFDAYIVKGLTKKQTADLLGCSEGNVDKWLTIFNLRRYLFPEHQVKRTIWNKGLTKGIHPSIAAGAKKKQGKLNPSFGKTPWNKGKTKDTDERLKIVSDKKTGVPLSDNHKQKLSEAKTGLRMEDTNNWRGGVHAPYPQQLDDKGHRKYTHRLIAEKILGAAAIKDKDVHHINGNKQDPTPENLLVISSKAHISLHKHFGFSTISASKGEQLEWLTDNGFSYLYVGDNL